MTPSGTWAGGDRLDAVIAGGGLSGLSLAAHLAAGGWSDRAVLVVDDPAATPRAASWAFWSGGPGLLDAAVSRTYRQVWVHAAGATRLLPLGRYRYRLVRRADLARVALDLLRRCPGYELHHGRVESIHDGAAAAEVVVDGDRIHATWAFDGTGGLARQPAGEVDARLAFTGWEVRCGRPVFDADTPTLFDFRTPQAGRARFLYVLPDDPYRALVELTEFVPRHAEPSTPADRHDAVAGYLDGVLRAGEYEVLRTESAVLPLRSRRPRRGGGRVLAIGARASLAKASTGYAYQRIQRDSDAIARSLCRRGHPFDIPSPRFRHRLLDALLLRVLDREPAELERAFARLFTANPIERMLRFLDEDTRVHEELRVMASVPPGPYLRAATTPSRPRSYRAPAGGSVGSR
jgi:lycopene beta-cyclase